MKIKDIEDKIPTLVTNKVKSEMSSITGLATITSLKDVKK